MEPRASALDLQEEAWHAQTHASLTLPSVQDLHLLLRHAQEYGTRVHMMQTRQAINVMAAEAQGMFMDARQTAYASLDSVQMVPEGAH